MPTPIERIDMVRDSTAEKIALYLATIARNTGGVEMSGWKYVQSLVRTGLHKELIKVGDQFVIEKETAMTARVGNVDPEGIPGITTASVTPLTFINKIGTAHSGDYEFEYDGAEWHFGGEAVDLTEYGITVAGTPVHGDVVIIHETAAQMRYVVLGIDQETPTDSQFEHSLTLGAVDVYADMQFDAAEALFAFPDGLEAGTYHFTVAEHPWVAGDVGKTVQFTIANAVAADGVLVLGNAYNATMIGSNAKIYASCASTTAAETVALSEGSGGTDLGSVGNAVSGNTNSIQRALLGSNRWSTSALRQYLNSDAAAGTYWAPQTKWDRPPSWVSTANGFLYGLDPDLVAVLGKVNKVTGLNTVTDGGGTETTSEKVFLLSHTEAYCGGSEGTAYDYYKNYSDLTAPGGGADRNRIKRLNGSAKYWWLRSPNPSGAGTVRGIYPSGTLISDGASYANGLVPACVIV